ncbi:MAG: N-6 DNA methylase [Ardenticatenia bacterium]|nr:N-6 DNA methylase [Ardenticatenia bacterium]
MPALTTTLRRQLEKSVIAARDVAEAGARAAVERLAVQRPEPYGEMAPLERPLRVLLRAHALQLGDARKAGGEQGIARLVAECAYAHWHRMLFARFLAENGLLIHPAHGVAVTLAECAEIAAEEGSGDGWELAGRYAARMLPAIIRPDDPVLRLRLAPEHQQSLEKLLAEIAPEVFRADDSLGWVYQFWQTRRKEEMNKSGRKIGADEISAVTQLFTEPYMVEFLLHNTLGAWWAGKVLAARPELARTAESEAELRQACALPGCTWNYLRFVREAGDGGLAADGDNGAGDGSADLGPWRPAAGSFAGWPERAADITMLDPCCGSGHFVVQGLRNLVPLRMAEEGLTAREACDAVLRDNIYGLEIDERCTQIAAFNLALAAWTFPGAGGYWALPEPHIACSGLSVGAREEDWLKLAGGDVRLREGMRRLYGLFKDAPTLGSLIDPRREFEAKAGQFAFDEGRFDELQPLLAQALAREEVQRDAAATEAGIVAQGMAKAAEVLAGAFTLVATNVPYLGRGKQDDVLKAHLEKHFKDGKADLATAFVMRCLELCAGDGSTALVTPQNWLFLTTYTKLRESLLGERTWNVVARLGPNAFQDMNWWAATTALLALSRGKPPESHAMMGIDVSSDKRQEVKAAMLRGDVSVELVVVSQAEQRKNPDSRITVSAASDLPPLADFADVYVGLQNGDTPRWVQHFWEHEAFINGWEPFHSTPERAGAFEGLDTALKWDGGAGQLALSDGAYMKGREAWGKQGVLCRQTRPWPTSQYRGHLYDQSSSVLIPKLEVIRTALLCFVSSEEFRSAMRSIADTVKFTNSTFVKVPFDLPHWQQVAAESYPNGLPEPESDDPTQWLFHGRPEASTAPLQVAVARVLGYRWPAELDSEMRLSQRARELATSCDELLPFADADGIVCIPPVRGEQPASDRLLRLLAQACGGGWTSGALAALLEQAGAAGRALDDWLRDGFFEQHCQLFHQRPFVWHIWDGRRRDGFAALVNYHKLDRKLLERLAYTVLGDWIAQQRHDAQAGERGAEDRLAAAEALQHKLALILEGQPPYDIFVRWKALRGQAIGWDPDLNDGVRMNIRPFIQAGVLRKNPRVKWTKDRGAEPQSLRPPGQFPWFWKDGQFTGERVNDVHIGRAEKLIGSDG